MKSIVNWWSTSYRRWVVEGRKNRLMKYYNKKDYLSLSTLFKNERDYQEVSVDQFPFLYFVISQNNKEALTALLKSFNFKDYLYLDDNNPLKCNLLMFAYLEDKQEMIEELENNGFSVGVSNSQGQNLLHLAAIYRRKEAFMTGLRKKINFNLSDMYGNTPFHYSCRSGQEDFVKALIAGKAEKTENHVHMYPIHMAVESNNPAVVQLLKDDLWLKYPLFHPIHSASRVGACQIMKKLLDKDASLLNLKDEKQLTPLHHAVATDHTDSVDFLLKQKQILVNQTDEFGNTPLHIAFMRDDIQCATRLINAKADLDLQNNDHLAPVDLGLDSSNLQMKTFLSSIAYKSKRLQDYRKRF